MARYGVKAFLQVAALAIFLRIVLLVYGEWQDRFLEVKYTDVDYWVFSDAAEAIRAGKSPFSRHTYRYTPLLAYLLVPNAWLGPVWGKVLFAAFDIVAGWIIYRFLVRSTNASRAAYLTAAFWLLNVMTFTISTRGNAESILCSLLLGSLYLLTAGRHALAGALFGAAVHLKLFPIIYAVAILAYLSNGKSRKSIDSPPISPKMMPVEVTPSPSPPGSPNASPTSSLKNRKKRMAQELASQRPSALATPQKIMAVKLSTPARRLRNIMAFFLSAAVIFALLGGFSYWKFGMEYIQEAVLYHLTRKDHRHNFSPYFYLFYTEAAGTALPRFSELLAFIPQALFFLAAGAKFGRKDLPFACFIITFVFVTFNKVITSQVRLNYLRVRVLIPPHPSFIVLYLVRLPLPPRLRLPPQHVQSPLGGPLAGLVWGAGPLAALCLQAGIPRPGTVYFRLGCVHCLFAGKHLDCRSIHATPFCARDPPRRTRNHYPQQCQLVTKLL